MTTLLRRVLAAALIAALAGLGAILALLGRRPRRRAPLEAKVPVPVAAPRPVTRQAPRGRGLAVATVCLLLLAGLAGVVYENRDADPAGGRSAPEGAGKPLAALSPPDAATARTPAPAGETPGGTVRTPATAGPPPSPPSASPTPDFDIVRVEPNGDAVIAGRAAPDAEVEALVNGKPVARARADAHGHFTLTPPSLPAGNSEIVLRVVPDGRGEPLHSATRVAVVVAPTGDAKPLVAVTSPGKPTLVLSQPEPGAARTGPAGRQGNRADGGTGGGRDAVAPVPNAPGPDAPNVGAVPRGPEPRGAVAGAEGGPGPGEGGSSPGSVGPTDDPVRSGALASGAPVPPKVVSIDAQDGGKLFVTARGAPGAALRLYLNGTLIAPATVGRDGTVTFTVGRGVQPGDYKVRLDLVDPATGKVRDRAEVPFTAPVPGRDGGVEYSAGGQDPARRTDGPEAAASGAATPSEADRARTATTGSLAANAPPGAAAAPSEVHIPGIKTARIERGDSLWRISRHTYGEGERYTLIYDANKEQIRDPDLIYPGQVFVLPPEQGGGAVEDGGPR